MTIELIKPKYEIQIWTDTKKDKDIRICNTKTELLKQLSILIDNNKWCMVRNRNATSNQHEFDKNE